MDGFKNSTKTQYWAGGATKAYAKGGHVKGCAQMSKTMAEFKGKEPVKKAFGGPIGAPPPGPAQRASVVPAATNQTMPPSPRAPKGPMQQVAAPLPGKGPMQQVAAPTAAPATPMIGRNPTTVGAPPPAMKKGGKVVKKSLGGFLKKAAGSGLGGVVGLAASGKLDKALASGAGGIAPALVAKKPNAPLGVTADSALADYQNSDYYSGNGFKKGGAAKGKAKIGKVMGEFESGKLHSGSKKGPVVTSPKQAKAIALSEARKAGAKIPMKKARGGSAEAGDVLISNMTDQELRSGARGIRAAEKRMEKREVKVPARKPFELPASTLSDIAKQAAAERAGARFKHGGAAKKGKC